MNEFLRNLKYNYSQRQTFRFFLFTYPKSSTLVSLISISGLLYATLIEIDKMTEDRDSFTKTIHSNENNPKRNKNILIYDSSQINK
jgi:hypothetical protein